ncbi:MAG: 50S ribosomal protein L25 [Minisyncoccia bacterium]
MIKIDVTKRDLKTSPDFLRSNNNVPAIFYGKKQSATPITVSKSQFKKVWREAGETSIVTLEGDGVDIQALIYEVKLDPVTDQPIHVDFYAFDKDQVLEIKVPVEFIGIAPAVRDLGGVLIKVMHEIEIAALPKDLPHGLTVDIATLTTMDSVIKAKDVILPAGVTLKSNPEDAVASITKIEEEVIEVAAPVDLSAIEVEKKGKEATAGEGGEAEGEAAAKPAAPKK